MKGEVFTLKRLNFLVEEIKGKVLYATLNGELDTFNSLEFGKIIKKSVSTNGLKNLVFNCEKLNFMASTGVGTMAFLLKDIKNHNKKGRVVMLNVNPRIYDVLSLLGFTSFFSFASSLEEALPQLETESSKELPIKKFPIVLKCPVCNKGLRAKKSGKFRCPSCKNIVIVDNNAKIRLG